MNHLQIALLYFFWLAARSKESRWLTFAACDVFAHPENPVSRVLHATIICPKTATAQNPNQHVMVGEFLRDMDMCPVRAFFANT